jgi:hypothetical protein
LSQFAPGCQAELSQRAANVKFDSIEREIASRGNGRIGEAMPHALYHAPLGGCQNIGMRGATSFRHRYRLDGAEAIYSTR